MYVRLCNNFEAKPFRLHNEIELIENHAGVNDSVPPSYTYTDSEAWTSELFRAGRQVSGSAILP